MASRQRHAPRRAGLGLRCTSARGVGRTGRCRTTEIAEPLATVVSRQGFNVEFLPLAEHLFCGSCVLRRPGTSCAHRPLRDAVRPDAFLSTTCTAGIGASSRPGCRPTSEDAFAPVASGRRTHLYEHADPARASTLTEELDLQPSSAAMRSAVLSSRAPPTGSDRFHSDGLRSMAWPRCSTPTTPARPASGSRTSTAAARTRCHRLPAPAQRDRHREPRHPDHRRGVHRLAHGLAPHPPGGLGSASSGTWGGCTTPRLLRPATPSTGAGTSTT